MTEKPNRARVQTSKRTSQQAQPQVSRLPTRQTQQQSAWRRRVLAAVSALATFSVLFVAGCSALPTSGEPHTFALETPSQEPISQFGSAPREGSDSAALIQDFLRASAAGVYDDYATARLYLTPDTSLGWVPGEQVLIFPTDEAPQIGVDEDGPQARVEVSLKTLGTLNANNVLVPSPKPGRASLTFDLEKTEDGEWRIVGLENVVLLSQSAFNNSFHPATLFFPSQDGQALVGDPRWYPRTPKEATLLVEGLLSGPSESVAPAVGGDVVAGWSLQPTGVEISDGLATVNLEGPTEVGTSSREELTWAVVNTVRQAPNVSGVEVALNSVPQETGGLPDGPDYLADEIIGIADGEVVSGAVGEVSVLVDKTRAGENPTNPAFSPVVGGPITWVRDSTELAILRHAERPETTAEVASPSKPSVDRHGNVWVVTGKGNREIRVFSEGRRPFSVALPSEVSGEPQAVEVSPDGSRVALTTRTKGGTLLWVGAIEWLGGEATIGGLQAVGEASLNTVDFTWKGSTTLVTLVKVGKDEKMSLETLPLGGWKETIGAPPSAIRVTASRAGGPVYIQETDGAIEQLSGVSWYALGTTPADVSFPG